MEDLEHGGDERSLEERALAHFVDDDHSETDDTEQLEAAEAEETDEVSADEGEDSVDGVEEVEFDGRVYQVPPELKEALMKGRDYTTKTQELARHRDNLELQQKQFEEFQKAQQFEQSLASEQNQLSQLEYQLGQAKNLNWADMSDSEILRNRQIVEQIKEQHQELKAAIDGKRGEFQKELEARKGELLKESARQLQRLIPNWGEAVAAEVSEFALSNGFTEHEVNNISSPRDVHTLWKAMQYDKLVSQKGEALKKASKAPPVVKPGSVKPMPQAKRDELNFRKAKERAHKSNATEGEMAKIIEKRLQQKFAGR